MELFLTEKLAGFDPAEKKKADAEIDDILESTMGLQSFAIPDLVIENSRAGLYIYLNACVSKQPQAPPRPPPSFSLSSVAHENSLLADHLSTMLPSTTICRIDIRQENGNPSPREPRLTGVQGDNPTAALHLILASFDVLANAVFRSEGQKAAHLLRSYLVNKVPLLLVSLAATASPLFPFNAQFCVAEALRGVDTNAFPTLSAMFDDTQQSSNSINDSVRQDFCFACCLHGLVSESSIEALLGEITYQTLPPGGRYIKENLVRDCIEDPERIQTLIKELENMDGNVGAVCQALTEVSTIHARTPRFPANRAQVLGQLCHNKETMPLKALCSQLVKNPLHLDVLLLFDKPITILQPLCDLLDNWGYDEDQSEYQPVYEEFGSVLLLLLAFVYRYDLSAADIGTRTSDSFVSKLLGKGRLARPLDELTEPEVEHVGGWLRGLFDNDAGGLGDDLMSSCPPQDFYMLIPTLFQQITQAFGQGQLAEENLRSGVECEWRRGFGTRFRTTDAVANEGADFVHTFLLPSLVTAILFLSDTLVEHPAEQKAILRILQLVLKPSSISTEAASMLSAVLNMVSKPLDHSLRAYQRQEPKSQDVEPLLKALKENLALSRRNGAADHTELEAWTGTANGGLAVALRNTVQASVHWSLNAGPSQMPTSYSHRQFLAALKMLGAPKVLDYILEEVKQQHVGAGQGAVAFDVACALVCAPDVTNSPDNSLVPLADGTAVPMQRRTTLLEALKARAEDWKKIEKTDAALAETVVRLYRKVESQMTIQAPAPVVLPTQLNLDASTALDEAMAVAAAAAAAAPADSILLDTSVDLGLDGGGDLSSFGAGSATPAGGLDFQGDDIFGSLDPLDGWGDIDMS